MPNFSVLAGLALFLLCIHTTTAGAQSSFSQANGRLAARIDSIVAHFLGAAPAAGLSVAVVRGRDTIVLRGYGDANREARRTATATTSYRIGSMTKQFTAAAVLQLVEQGRLSVDDSLGALLPQYATFRGITIRQLLNHTSGIAPFNTSPRWFPRRTEALPADTVLAMVAGAPLAFEPGSRFLYSNTGYLLLGRVVEHRSGLSLEEFFRSRFFAPLQMTSARVCTNEPSASDDAQGYDLAPEGFVKADPLDVPTFGGSGALCMSVVDFLRWQTAFTTGRIVSPAMYWRMSTSDTLNSGRSTRYGWGLIPRLLAGRDVVSHGGDINGFGAEQLWFSQDSLRVIVFVNTFAVEGPSQLAEDIARAVLGLEARPTAITVDAPIRKAIAGSYALRLPNGGTVTMVLWEAGERVMARMASPGQQAFQLTPLANGEFGSSLVPSLRIKVTIENGRGTTFELRQNGIALQGERASATPPAGK